MKPSEKVIVALLGATAVAAGLVLEQTTKDAEGLISITVPALITVAAGTPTWVVGAPDGGRMYVTKNNDGGSDMKRVVAGGCVRRSVGGSALTCRRKDPDNALDLVGLLVGPLNRFPASQAMPAVNDCEPCACAVFQGEDSNKDEAEIVNDLIGELLP